MTVCTITFALQTGRTLEVRYDHGRLLDFQVLLTHGSAAVLRTELIPHAAVDTQNADTTRLG